MLARVKHLAEVRADFAFETTLASRNVAPWLRALASAGYRVGLIHLWLPSAEHAIARVRLRASRGGHAVAGEVVRRRFHAGLANFFRIYQPLSHR